MRKIIIFIVLFAVYISIYSINADYKRYFKQGSLRIDYFHTGNAKTEEITLDRIYEYKIWAGNPDNLISNSKIGTYHIKVYDFATKKLIFSNDYNSYFSEYQTSTPAIKGIKKTFSETALIPLPKKKIIFTIKKRDRSNKFKKIYSTIIDNNDLLIIKNQYDSEVTVYNIQTVGSPAHKVDIAVIAEGYTRKEMKKAKNDFEKFKNIFFSQEPYKSRKNDFNIYGIFKPSVDSGCDEPSRRVFKNTVLDTTFYSMRSARYLLTESNKKLRDLASHTPYDTIFIMVNHNRYGGGGIYNFYCTFTADNDWSKYLLLHEFGHSFTGLADEYYSSDTAYNEFYPRGIEPVEPNITALLDSKNIKWKKFLTKGIEIPTKWKKTKYDEISSSYQKKRRDLNKRIAKLKREKANPKLIERMMKEAKLLSINASKKADNFLKKSKYANMTGAFEGAGYSSKGFYRPMLDCIMFSKGVKPYCSVCFEAINKKIDYYTKKR